MALPVNVTQVASDALLSGAGAWGLQAVTDYFNIPFLSSPAVFGVGMNNAELLLNATGGLAVAGAIFSLISKRKLIGTSDKNLLGTGLGLLLATATYNQIVAPFVNQVPTV